MAHFSSTTTALNSGQTVTLGPFQTDRGQNITGTVFADQAGTLYIEQSFDGTNWDKSTSISVSASAGQGFTEAIIAPIARVRYVNGGTNQGTFRLYARAIQTGAT